MLFFGIKIPTTKHEIMLHAMSLNDGSRTSTNVLLVLTRPLVGKLNFAGI